MRVFFFYILLISTTSSCVLLAWPEIYKIHIIYKSLAWQENNIIFNTNRITVSTLEK